MNLDNRFDTTRDWIAGMATGRQPDPLDLDIRHRRRRRAQVMTTLAAVFALVLGSVAYALERDDGGQTVTAGPAGAIQTPSSGTDQVLERSDGVVFIPAETPAGWAVVDPAATVDHSLAFEGETYSEVHVRFEDLQEAFSSLEGELAGTVRVSVGTYDRAELDAAFGEPSDQVTISGRDFDVVVTADNAVTRTALVPVDASERTFLIVARGVDVATLVEMAEPIDPSKVVPVVGPAPEAFVVLHAGIPDLAALSEGTSVTFRSRDGDITATFTTFDGVRISCFAHAWPYSDTEITRIGGDAGVLSQLDGDPDATGTYRALWNRDSDTLIHVAAVGIDRATLIDLADTLTQRENVDGAYRARLQLIG